MENMDAGRGQEVTQVTGGFDPESPDFKEVQRGAETYSIVLMKFLHGKETRDLVMDILKSSDEPFDTVPEAVNKINDIASKTAEQGGQKISQDVQLASSVFLFNDIVELGKAAGIFQVPEEEMTELYQDCIEIHIQKGLKDGSIDPIQLQLDTEELMTEHQKAGGMGLAEFSGTPQELSQAQMTEQYAQDQVRNAEAKGLDKKTKDKAQAMGKMQQGPAQQALQQPGGQPQAPQAQPQPQQGVA